jgi:hypothetical protein
MPSSTANADIFSAHRLQLAEKPFTKTESLLSKKSSSKPSYTADTEIFSLHRLPLAQKLLTKTGSLGHKNHPRSLVLRLPLTSSAHIDYCWLRNRCQKLSPCYPKNHPRNPVLWPALKSSVDIDHCWLNNHWQKGRPYGPKKIQEPQLYGLRWYLQRI